MWEPEPVSGQCPDLTHSNTASHLLFIYGFPPICRDNTLVTSSEKQRSPGPLEEKVRRKDFLEQKTWILWKMKLFTSTGAQGLSAMFLISLEAEKVKIRFLFFGRCNVTYGPWHDQSTGVFFSQSLATKTQEHLRRDSKRVFCLFHHVASCIKREHFRKFSLYICQWCSYYP